MWATSPDWVMASAEPRVPSLTVLVAGFVTSHSS